jgi:CRISPR-associated protein Csb1
MSEMTKTIDDWSSLDSSPAALVLRENLMPVEGRDGVLFPPTFAGGTAGFKGGYNIDELKDGTKVCLVDSVGSQANRIEPMFAEEKYRDLIPQIVIKAGMKEINIVEVGHRAGDALARCSALKEELHDAFKAVLMGNAEPLAKIAPTSLVFGVWDSRDTQAKLPRLVSSTIRAFDVEELTRSAQFVPATEYVVEGLLDEPKDKKAKDAYSERGFIHVPSSATHGGIIATGGVRRDATLSLSALRLIKAKDAESTTTLRRYILGLALIALTAETSSYLRQGCNLVFDPEKGCLFEVVYRDGNREKLELTHNDAVEYAEEAARGFGVGESRVAEFDKKKAKAELQKN